MSLTKNQEEFAARVAEYDAEQDRKRKGKDRVADEDAQTLADDASTLAPTLNESTTTSAKKDLDNTLLPPSTLSEAEASQPSSSKSRFGSRIKKLLTSPAADREKRILAQRPPPDPSIPKEILRQREWYGKGYAGLPRNPNASSPGSQY
jgi:hypothetical protein